MGFWRVIKSIREKLTFCDGVFIFKVQEGKAMLTETKSPLNAPADIEEVEYSPEVVERWDSEFEITMLQIESGEIQYKPVEALAAEYGIALDE